MEQKGRASTGRNPTLEPNQSREAPKANE